MANCPCEDLTATCVDSDAPISRVLDGDCVTFSLDILDGDTVDLEVTGEGQLTAEVIISPDADNLVEARENGIYVTTEESQNRVERRRCGKCESDLMVDDLAAISDSCTGLEVRQCESGLCDDDENGYRFWVPPPIEGISFSGQDIGAFKFGPLEASQALPGGTGASTGDRATNGITIRSVPHTSAGGNTITGLNFSVENEWCSPAFIMIWADAGAGFCKFTEGDTEWVLDFYLRVWEMDPDGAVHNNVSDSFRVVAAQQANNESGFVVPGAGEGMPFTTSSYHTNFRLANPGEVWRFRAETVCYVVESGNDDVVFAQKPQLEVRGMIQTIHRRTSMNVGDLSA